MSVKRRGVAHVYDHVEPSDRHEGRDPAHRIGPDGSEPVSWLAATRRVFAILRTLKRHDVLGLMRPGASPPSPEQLRLALEELGIVFVKLGQVLALRRDLLPSAYVEALESLHDRLPPIPWEEVEAEVGWALGRPVAEAFAELDPEPLAAASVAQVHEGRTHDGRHVAVKVRRPGIEGQVVEDSAALALLATWVERVATVARRFDAAGFVLEFRRSMERELDFRHEARNIRRFRESLGDLDGLWIPNVIPELSTSAVLTMEHSPGQRIDHYVRKRPEEAERLAPLVAALVLRQIFENGLFHADPHPGNLFVLPDGRLCLHDFGMVGELNEPMREALGDLLAAEVRGDARSAVAAYLRLGLPGSDVDKRTLENEFQQVLDKLHSRPLSEISLGGELQELMRAGSRGRVRNPRELLLLGRALLIAEALLRRLDPELDVIEIFRRQLTRLELQRVSPDRLLERGLAAARSLERLSRDLPAALEALTQRLEQGDSGAQLDHRVRNELVALRRTVALVGGAVAAGLIGLAGALLATAGDGGAATVGLALVLAGALGAAWGVLRALWRN
jgi:ubiquinone biosynthesis protein